MPAPKWDYQSAAAEARKYDGVTAFKYGSSGAYGWAERHGVLKKITAHYPPRGNRRKYTEEYVTELAAPFDNVADFIAAYPVAHAKASEYGFLAKVTAHMTRKKNPNGHWNDPLNCMVEARKYKTKADWYRGSSSSYNAALKHGFMDMCSWHMDDHATTDNDAIYVWEWVVDGEGTGVYKGGLTSWKLGDQRIKDCARDNGMDYRLVFLLRTGEQQARAIEQALLDSGHEVEMPETCIEGRTEFRRFHPDSRAMATINQLAAIAEGKPIATQKLEARQ